MKIRDIITKLETEKNELQKKCISLQEENEMLKREISELECLKKDIESAPIIVMEEKTFIPKEEVVEEPIIEKIEEPEPIVEEQVIEQVEPKKRKRKRNK